jgi:hypothetical protein
MNHHEACTTVDGKYLLPISDCRLVDPALFSSVNVEYRIVNFNVIVAQALAVRAPLKVQNTTNVYPLYPEWRAHRNEWEVFPDSHPSTE